MARSGAVRAPISVLIDFSPGLAIPLTDYRYTDSTT